MNLVYNETEKRGFFKLNLVSLTFTILAILFVLVAIGAMIVVPIVLDFLGLGGATEMLVKIARWPALFIVVTLALAVLYRYGPSREKAKWRWITTGDKKLRAEGMANKLSGKIRSAVGGLKDAVRGK